MRSLLGVNVPYFFGSYAHDLAPNPRFPDWPCDFDAMRVSGPLLEARALGLEAVRVWLCEGGEGLALDANGHVRGVRPELLDAITVLEEAAQRAGTRVYWGLLDANSVHRDRDAITRSILEDRDQGARFAEHVAAVIAARLDPRIAVGLELLSEPETLTEDCADARPAGGEPSIGWDAIGHFLAHGKQAIESANASLVVTAGSMPVFLPKLFACGAELDAVDVHVYHDNGGLPSRADLARYASDPRILEPSFPLLAGECGIPKDPGPAEPLSLLNYLANADRCGYHAAFLWKLEGDLVEHAPKKIRRAWTAMGHEARALLASRPAGGF
ncbi:MAG: hypothetical protein K1X94_00940 [Sandaracinaceae bacterium]|nr:hypothetical protein [Sandaracinaceae bacterium]